MVQPSKLARRAFAVAIAAAVALAAAGCKETIQGSCDWRPAGNNRCFDYGSDYKEAQQSCDGKKVWSTKPCDLSGALGGCKTIGTTTKWLWPDAKLKTKADAQVMECPSGWLEPARN